MYISENNNLSLRKWLMRWIRAVNNSIRENKKKKINEKQNINNLKCRSFGIVSLETGHPNVVIIFSQFFHSIWILAQ